MLHKFKYIIFFLYVTKQSQAHNIYEKVTMSIIQSIIALKKCITNIYATKYISMEFKNMYKIYKSTKYFDAYKEDNISVDGSPKYTPLNEVN